MRTVPNDRSAPVERVTHQQTFRGGLPADSLQHLGALLKTQWKRYRKRLRRCQENFSEEAVHESRVETRRLLSTVELLGAFVREGRIRKAHRALKRHLDSFDDLRDTQVQLLYVRKMVWIGQAVRLFHAYLSKREDRYTSATRKRIKRIKTKRLGQLIAGFKKELRRQRKHCHPRQAQTILLLSVNRAYARVVQLKARIDPGNTVTIHRTRIAFKKYRYMVEALEPLLFGVSEKRVAEMRHYQTMMGDIQDLEVLLETLGKFFQKHEVKAESARHFRDELLRRRHWLIRRYMAAADTLREFRPRPVTEIKSTGTIKQGGRR